MASNNKALVGDTVGNTDGFNGMPEDNPQIFISHTVQEKAVAVDAKGISSEGVGLEALTLEAAIYMALSLGISEAMIDTENTFVQRMRDDRSSLPGRTGRIIGAEGEVT